MGKTKEDEDVNKENKKYCSVDTELGRFYNKALNDHFSQDVYLRALDYEMMKQNEKSIKLVEERVDRLETRVQRLEDEK